MTDKDTSRDTMSGTSHTTKFSTEDVNAILKLKDFVVRQPIFLQLRTQKVEFNWSECCPGGCDAKGNIYVPLTHSQEIGAARVEIYPLLAALWEEMNTALQAKVVFIINDEEVSYKELTESIKAE